MPFFHFLSLLSAFRKGQHCSNTGVVINTATAVQRARLSWKFMHITSRKRTPGRASCTRSRPLLLQRHESRSFVPISSYQSKKNQQQMVSYVFVRLFLWFISLRKARPSLQRCSAETATVLPHLHAPNSWAIMSRTAAQTEGQRISHAEPWGYSIKV